MKALVLDGYNVIFKIPYLRERMDKSLEGARKGVTQLAKEYQRKCGGIAKISVVFDGQDRYQEFSRYAPRHHVYSRTGEGDREVIRAVSKLSKDYAVEVVTDDNYVRNNARAHNSGIISIEQFLKVINKSGKVKPAKSARDSKKLSSEDASEITEQLRKHYKI